MRLGGCINDAAGRRQFDAQTQVPGLRLRWTRISRGIATGDLGAAVTVSMSGNRRLIARLYVAPTIDEVQTQYGIRL